MTNQTNHSPAPWQEEETEDGDIFVVMDEGHRVLIGNLEDTCGTCHANAMLIKAAPKILEALKNILEHPYPAGMSLFSERTREIAYEKHEEAVSEARKAIEEAGL